MKKEKVKTVIFITIRMILSLSLIIGVIKECGIYTGIFCVSVVIYFELDFYKDRLQRKVNKEFSEFMSNVNSTIETNNSTIVKLINIISKKK
jgi:hypothetical protein